MPHLRYAPALAATLLAAPLLAQPPATTAPAPPSEPSAATEPAAAPAEATEATKATEAVEPITPADLPDAQRAQIEAAVAKVYPALVRIEVVSSEPGQGRMDRERGFGSGTIIDTQGHVVTNHHVAGHAQALRVTLPDRRVVDAELVGTDPLADLAVIKLDLSELDPNQPLPTASWGDSDALKVGDLVMAMGSPAGLSQSVTVGVVSNTQLIPPMDDGGLVLDGESVSDLVRWIGHDAVIARGNSGGALVNAQGELVGVNEVGISSIGGAIPSNLAREVARQLIAQGKVARSTIGLEVQPLLRGDDKLEHGALVSSVLEDGPASRAGIRPGDLLFTLNGQPIPPVRAREDRPVFNRSILETPVGQQITLTGERDGQPQSWTVTTELRHPAEGKAIELPNWGLIVRDLTPATARAAHRQSTEGVQIVSIRPGRGAAAASPALSSEDIVVEVNRQPIASSEQLASWTDGFTANLTKPEPVLVRFIRAEQEMVSLVEVGPEPNKNPGRRAASAWFGAAVQAVTEDLAEVLGHPGQRGVLITKVSPGSPAEVAGVKVGDLITQLDGRQLNIRREEDSGEFAAIVRQYRIGDPLPVTVLRGSETVEIPVILGASPIPANEQPEHKFAELEFSLRTASDLEQTEEADKLTKAGAPAADAEPAGLIVSEVEKNGWAQLGGLNVNDRLLRIEGQPVNALDDAVKALDEAKASQRPTVVLFVRRGLDTRFVEINSPWIEAATIPEAESTPAAEATSAPEDTAPAAAPAATNPPAPAQP